MERRRGGSGGKVKERVLHVPVVVLCRGTKILHINCVSVDAARSD